MKKDSGTTKKKYLGKTFKSQAELNKWKHYELPKILNSIRRYWNRSEVVREVYENFEIYKNSELRRFAQCNAKGIPYKVGLL